MYPLRSLSAVTMLSHLAHLQAKENFILAGFRYGAYTPSLSPNDLSSATSRTLSWRNHPPKTMKESLAFSVFLSFRFAGFTTLTAPYVLALFSGVPVRQPLFSFQESRRFPFPFRAALQLKIYGMGGGLSSQIGEILELSLFVQVSGLRNFGLRLDETCEALRSILRP